MNDQNGQAAFKGIQEVAAQLGVTHRTLRFYEEQGLIEPERIGATRVYSRREIGRMQLILRGKRLGFSIREIREFLDLYDTDPDRSSQTARLQRMARERLDDLEQQRVALEETMEELRQIEADCTAKLAARGVVS